MVAGIISGTKLIEGQVNVSADVSVDGKPVNFNSKGTGITY